MDNFRAQFFFQLVRRWHPFCAIQGVQTNMWCSLPLSGSMEMRHKKTYIFIILNRLTKFLLEHKSHYLLFLKYAIAVVA